MVSVCQIMFANSLDYVSGGDAKHCRYIAKRSVISVFELFISENIFVFSNSFAPIIWNSCCSWPFTFKCWESYTDEQNHQRTKHVLVVFVLVSCIFRFCRQIWNLFDSAFCRYEIFLRVSYETSLNLQASLYQKSELRSKFIR